METFFDFALKPQINGTDELYFRSEGFVSENGIMTAEKSNTEVSFDTYFNMIPCSKIKVYTNAEEIFFSVCGKDIETELFASNGYDNISLGNEMRIKVSDIPENAVYIYPVVRAKSSGAVLAGFLRFRNEKHKDVSISGSMLYIDKPNIQFESGGRFEADGSQNSFGHFLDMTVAKNLSDNEQPQNANYGGWWFMCMPMRYVNEGNYPIPFFIKYDDVEYALRCKPEIITLNGVNVWHEPFEWKYNSA